MVFLNYPIRDLDGDLAFIVIVDEATQQAWTLETAGGDPAPATGADVEFIADHAITDPDDVVGVIVRNMLVAADPATSHQYLPAALEAADRVLFAAQGGREPRANLPVDVVSVIAQLQHDGERLQAQVAAAVVELQERLTAVRSVLTQPIHLPDRHASVASEEELAHAEASLQTRLDQIDHSILAATDEADGEVSVGEGATAMPEPDRGVDRKDSLESLGLSTRVLSLLHGAGITTVDQLVRKTDRSLRAIRGFGPSALEEVTTTLDQFQLHLKAPTRAVAARAGTTKPATPKREVPAGFARGRIKTVRTDRGFGFIIPSDGGEDLFFHVTAVRDMELDESMKGRVVIFRAGTGHDGRLRALEVLPWQ